jgi:hypothetical protein
MTSEAFVGRVNAFASSRGNVMIVYWLIRPVFLSFFVGFVFRLFFFFFFTNYMFKGRIETNENRRRAGELVTLLDEPYRAFLFNYLPSPLSSPAVGAMSVVVTVAYIAAAVEVSFACLCSQLCYIVKSRYQDCFIRLFLLIERKYTS